ncbi:hypothetical protein BT93_E0455 [Corymbia citriodora subsp. variegata]|nr:hypothetical protein BT93_E0455 [Corymbia citriodora subsp. variegata]
MASPSLNLYLASRLTIPSLAPSPPPPPPPPSPLGRARPSGSASCRRSCVVRSSFPRAALRFPGGATVGGNRRSQSQIVRMAPEEEKMTRRSPLDFPIEWERPKPGRRPDIFPQFSPMKTPLPPPLPADPPEEDEEEEEKKEEEEEDPEREETEKPEGQ